MSEIDFNLLTALDALLQEGSVTGAAHRLGLSASAMSRTLTRLRQATGDPLLVRAGRGLVPTPHAAELRERVRGLAGDVHAVLQPARAGFDAATLTRSFTLRANEGFVEAFSLRLVKAVAAIAPGVRLRFAPKPDKDVQPLREGSVDLDIGVLGRTGAELRIQTLFQDRFVGVVRTGHPLIAGPNTAEHYASYDHVVTSRRGSMKGPVDVALAALGLSRNVVVVVSSFPAALTLARASDLVALLPSSFMIREHERQPIGSAGGLVSFPLPVQTDPITISQMWHPRMDADPAHRWLRGLVRSCCTGAISL